MTYEEALKRMEGLFQVVDPQLRTVERLKEKCGGNLKRLSVDEQEELDRARIVMDPIMQEVNALELFIRSLGKPPLN